MQKRKVYFANFFSGGSFVANESTMPVDSSDPRKVKWPEDAYAFTLHELNEVVDGDEVFRGTACQLGPTYYHHDSMIETIDEVRKNPKSTSIMISNMECNGWDAVIWNRFGGFPQPYRDGEIVILRPAEAQP